MYAFLLAASFLTSIAAGVAPQEDPAVRFLTHDDTITTSQAAGIYLQNRSGAPLHDVVVTLTFADGLKLHGDLRGYGAWVCANDSAQSASCRIDMLGSNEEAGFVFHLLARTGTGGDFAARATITAGDLPPVPPIDFNVASTTNYIVSTGEDFGAGSLRDAIELINENPLCGTDVPCMVSFGSAMTISPTIPLPPIRKCNVDIAGREDYIFPFWNQENGISGGRASYGNGLEIRATCAPGVPGVSITNIAVHSWPWNGIYFEAPEAQPADFAGHRVLRANVGVATDGWTAAPNGARGIVTDSPHEVVQISDSIISANGRSGVAFWRGKHGSIVGSKIGVDRDDKPMGNRAAGVFSNGVPFSVEFCLIAHNQTGVSIAKGTPKAAISGSEIYWNEGLPIDWGLDARTPSDDDESDAIPNAPQVVEVIYNESEDTISVRGFVRLRAGTFTGKFGLAFYIARSERGDVEAVFHLPPASITAHATGDVSFDVTLPMLADPRGRFISAQTQVLGQESEVVISSEISEAVIVR